MKCLIIKKPWIDYILDGFKTWEIRSCNTKIRGKIGLIQSGSGLIVGSCEIMDSYQIAIDDYKTNKLKHRIKSVDKLPYKNTYAWVIKNAKRYDNPIPYNHPKGAIIWVNLNSEN